MTFILILLLSRRFYLNTRIPEWDFSPTYYGTVGQILVVVGIKSLSSVRISNTGVLFCLFMCYLHLKLDYFWPESPASLYLRKIYLLKVNIYL